MSIVIQPYRQEHQPAVKLFNQRLRAATNDPDLVFYESCHPSWLPKIEGNALYNEYFVAVEGDAVRGAYALKHERFFLPAKGEYAVACYHHPLSEGIIDRKYSTVGGLLLRDALRREPMLYALGMGGLDRPLAQMLKTIGWNLYLVPFCFLVLRPYRFLRQMAFLRTSRWKRWLMDIGAFTATGWAALTAIRTLRNFTREDVPFEMEEFNEFPDWAETLWLEAGDAYALTSVRDHSTLSRLYPPSESHLIKLGVKKNGKPVGWAVVGERRRDAKFGTLRVGSIVDCWAGPEHAQSVILAAVRAIEQKGMDLIVSNQSHRQWGKTLLEYGFIRTKSNFVFAVSKEHYALIQPASFSDFHLTRANGDGLPRNF